jgi:aconitate decarboxylase
MMPDVAHQPLTGESTRQLAEFASALSYDDIPVDVVDHIKLCILDSLGCGLYGATLPWSVILRDTISAVDQGTAATVIGSAVRLGVVHAALVNGAAIHAFELDDLHPQSIVHPGSVVIPAALAAAEHRGDVPGAELITAIVAGYEVAARVGMSVGAAHLLQGWHPTGTHGTFGAAAAAGSVLKLSPAEMVDALGTAGTQAGGLMSAQYASMVKRFHAGRAAQSGLYGALLARNGYRGIGNIFEADYGGYGPTFSPSYDMSMLTKGLGAQWETRAVGFKPYSANGSCHPSIDALRDLRAAHGLRLDNVAAIRLSVSTATVKHVGWPYVPGSITTAQMNLPFITAVTIADGDAFVEQFTPGRITAAELVEFSRRVTVEADPRIDAEGDAGRHHTRIAVTMTSGEVLEDERRFARGSARRPMTAGEVEEKFGKLTAASVPASRRERLLRGVRHLEDLPVSELAADLGRPPTNGDDMEANPDV